jgi:hypothetical protein
MEVLISNVLQDITIDPIVAGATLALRDAVFAKKLPLLLGAFNRALLPLLIVLCSS